MKIIEEEVLKYINEEIDIIMRYLPISSLRAFIRSYLKKEILKSDITVFMERLYQEDKDLYRHSISTAIISILICKGLNMSLTKKNITFSSLIKGALLHDIGKLYIDREILYRPCPLTTEEYEEVKKHPTLGVEYVLSLVPDIYPFVVECIATHHEREDSSGYPTGSTMMCFPAKVVACADVFSALIIPRVYKPSFTQEQVTDTLLEQALDPTIRDILINELMRREV